MSRRHGFSLLEIIIFVGMFSAVIVAFLAIMISVSTVHVRGSSAAEVATQSQFLLQTIQYNVERSSLIEMTKDITGSTLTLRASSTSLDPTVITLSGTKVTISQGGGGAEDLTTSKVKVTDLDFTKRENPNGRDSVQVAFSMEYSTDNVSRRFVNRIQSSVARVSAATFDSNIVPGASTYDIGSSASQWRDGYFSSKVGIGVSSPQTPLHVAGGNIYASDAGSGIVFKGPNGTSCYLFALSNAGLITTSSVACP